MFICNCAVQCYYKVIQAANHIQEKVSIQFACSEKNRS